MGIMVGIVWRELEDWRGKQNVNFVHSREVDSIAKNYFCNPSSKNFTFIFNEI